MVHAVHLACRGGQRDRQSFVFGSQAQDSEFGGPIGIVTNFLLVIPQFTATVRRLHDTGRSAWYVLAPFVGFAIAIGFGAVAGPSLGQPASIIVGIVMIVSVLLPSYWLLQRSQPGANRYGPYPSEVLT